MATCADVATFLRGVNARSVTSSLSDGDLAALAQYRLVSVLTADELAQTRQDVTQLAALQSSIATETSQRRAEAADLAQRTQKSHSFFFRLENQEKQAAAGSAIQQETSQLQSIDQDLAKQEQQFSDLMAKQAVLETATPYSNRFVAVTGAGQVALRDLSVRLYRASDMDFAAYWTEAQEVDGELGTIADNGATAEGGLRSSLAKVDPAYLWALGIGIAKQTGDLPTAVTAYLAAYSAIQGLGKNLENRLMAAEVLSAPGGAYTVPVLTEVFKDVQRHGIPGDAALGIAAILLSGRRADGTLPTDLLTQFRTRTASFEAAALLAIVNRPYDELAQRFDTVRSLFASWGYSPSEDTELSGAYLAVSELPLETVGPKLAIISRGMATYLQYPLVASSILASIPVLEANETLNLVEKAYDILGRRTGPMAQPELICLSVRMVHGIRIRSVDELDATAAAQPATPGGAPIRYGYVYYPPWVPFMVVHGAYYSTFSAIGGAHPAHVHGMVAGGFAGGG